MWSWFLWNLLRVLLWHNSWSTFLDIFSTCTGKYARKRWCVLFFSFVPSLSLYIMLSKDLKIQKVQLINSRCINICMYYRYMHTYHIHQCLSPAGTCGTLKHQWPRISTGKGRQSLFKSISGKNWDQNFEIFPPTWPLSDTAASTTQARITYTHSHIKTGFSQSFQPFITVFCSYFMEATSLWLVHFF